MPRPGSRLTWQATPGQATENARDLHDGPRTAAGEHTKTPNQSTMSSMTSLYYIISYHIISYHIISYYIILYHIISYHIISYYIILYHIILYIILYHITDYISHITYHITDTYIYTHIVHITY